MANENPIRTLGDYSKPSHEGYRNTIELPEGNNVFTPKRVPSFRWHRLWLQVQIFYDHVNPATRRTIDQSAGGKLRDRNAKESSALLEDLALYNNESLNDPRDFRYRWSRRIHLCSRCPEYIRPSSHRARKPSPTLDGSSSCSKETCYSEQDLFFIRYLAVVPNPQTLSIAWKSRQAFVDYASSRVDEARGLEQTLEDELKDLHLNLLGLKVLAHALMYNSILDKYVESLELSKNESAFIQGEMTKRKEDPGLFTLPCRLGDSKPFDTLADLGSCVNIIPLYLFKKLNIGLLEETDHVFGLADGTKSYPIGIVRDVEVHIGRLKILNEFYVIDMKKDPETPLLVGRGFLATTNAVIDCRKSKIAVGEGITRSVFRVKRIELGAIPINLKRNMWESEDLIENPINWDKPPKNGNGTWHAKIRIIDPGEEEFTKTFQSIPTSRKLYEKENPREIIDLDHFHDTIILMRRRLDQTEGEIIAKVGTVAYRLELPEKLSRVHSTFHVSKLKKCMADEPLAIPLDEIQVDDKLNFIEEPVEIMDREVKRLKQSRIPIVKVRWNSKRGPEFTWEREDQMQKKYPHLFTNSAPAAEVAS
ncbi:MAK10-like protein [Tanacetum coccineum]